MSKHVILLLLRGEEHRDGWTTLHLRPDLSSICEIRGRSQPANLQAVLCKCFAVVNDANMMLLHIFHEQAQVFNCR